jgi:FkbM family methyltransferase
MKGFVRKNISNPDISFSYITKNRLIYEKSISLDGECNAIKSVLEKVSEGDIIFDVGANFGLYTVPISSYVKSGKVYSFEPSEKWINLLMANVCLNSSYNVRPLQIALGKESKDVKFFVKNVGGSGMGSYIPSYQSKIPEGDSKTIYAKVCRMDDLVRCNLLPIPNVVKIDVEGAEKDVIDGGMDTISHDDCHTILVEVHDVGDKKEVERKLDKCGFRNVKEWGREPEVLLLWTKG